MPFCYSADTDARHPLNSVSSKSMVPKIKLLFLSGALKGQKYLFDSNVQEGDDEERGARQKFEISASKKADIVVEGMSEDRKIVLVHTKTSGWTLEY